MNMSQSTLPQLSEGDAELLVSKLSLSEEKQALLDSASSAHTPHAGSFDELAALRPLLDRMPHDSQRHALFDSIKSGVEIYAAQHGRKPGADVLNYALGIVFQDSFNPLAVKNATSHSSLANQPLLDSASSAHHDNYSLMPNQIIAAVLGVFDTAIPFAQYVPVNIGSNEALIAPISFSAANSVGNRATGDSLTGINAGAMAMGSERVIDLKVPAAGGTGPFTATVTAQFGKRGTATEFTPAAVSATNYITPLLRGRAYVTVNGIPVARESSQNGSGNSALAGTATLMVAGVPTSFAITGTVNDATGDISVSSAPALPANTKLHATVYVDFENKANASVVPMVKVDATRYSIFASPAHGAVDITQSARTQFSNELGLDPRAQALVGLRTEYSISRLITALNKMSLVASSNSTTYDFDFASQKQQKNRAQIMVDFCVKIAGESQKMANRSGDQGITHIFVTGIMRDMFLGMEAGLFVSSGVTDTAGIYRLGTLQGKYEVYYSPTVLKDTSAAGGATSTVLCIGRGSNPVFAPILVGDAVAPMLFQASTTASGTATDGFYARTFTEINPDPRFAGNACEIVVSNLL
jgi:uncharacterized Zn-binding protein involved in type VI secretion